MKQVTPIIVALLVTAFMFAAEEPKTEAAKTQDLKTAQVLAVKKYDRGRIVRWDGRVPIFDDLPFCDITLSLDGKKYVVRYESGTGYYPSRWKAGNEIQLRFTGKGKTNLLNGSEEVPVGIFNNKAQDCVFANAPPATLSVGPQVPCD
ncbi:MAG: hypothetical protein L0Z53_02500 [Acidobacteriales bacterium]|nr:hypothetical protein [Terriglobales bacterium]